MNNTNNDINSIKYFIIKQQMQVFETIYCICLFIAVTFLLFLAFSIEGIEGGFYFLGLYIPTIIYCFITSEK